MTRHAPHDPPRPKAQVDDPADSQRTLTLSEEHLAVTTRQMPVAKVRLERYQVTETRTITVDVVVDRVRLVNIADGVDPYITDDPAADPVASDPAQQDPDATQWLVLSEEQVVITKKLVPVERIGLAVDTITVEQAVTETVRAERVELDTTGTDSPAS